MFLWDKINQVDLSYFIKGHLYSALDLVVNKSCEKHQIDNVLMHTEVPYSLFNKAKRLLTEVHGNNVESLS